MNRLASILNETLRVTEEDTIAASVAGTEENFGSAAVAGTSAACAPPRSPKSPRLISKLSRMPAAPTHKLMAVSKTLNQQLTELLVRFIIEVSFLKTFSFDRFVLMFFNSYRM